VINAQKLAAGLVEQVRAWVAPALDSVRADNARLQKRLDKSDAMVASLERRLSRNSDHLNRIESRLKNLEHE
jgi:septal ring factor EnvC (AmiA/AmiB activator)